MTTIKIVDRVGSFAENKDVARDIRLTEIMPALDKQEEVVLNFRGVDAVTQSFIHALISEVLRKYGDDVFDQLAFKSCNKTVKQIINIVVDYMQDGMGREP